MLRLYEEDNVKAIADSIREKNGGTDTYSIAEMASAISSLSVGEGGSNIRFATGSVTLDSSVTSTTSTFLTVTHNLGVVPAIVVIWRTAAPTTFDSSATYNIIYGSVLNNSAGLTPSVNSHLSTVYAVNSSGTFQTPSALPSLTYVCDSITKTTFRLRSGTSNRCWAKGATYQWLVYAPDN